ncbi:TPA: hypothetical protein DDW69_03935 [candidate division CPR2 bacterium]|uniref:DUF2229 domain-containing protein n=1 Tax=candidate division CPR2 bacterium GW2011_GWC1_41_48 TaxID=1618344 RepID=A0A0G0W7H3_UNCC2|nr:MAG: hypothetical protein UT47_C0003G0025 [candidate division CPR2 bacterium GW2011_GWC2_39_35]KKR28895.1 MAG: hypothetical protein UT60_C0010G0013 [candidate division CPR2 bacterium GW2011_GWD2_39_7]KKS08964.1 MAG: hypothetical protein UU65_C0003G0019 [candidate division CPR2 bacterium GW2011_GWC1_41_48]OGB70267.1 MAG: hypothetical protein A2Y26_02140 [candidate division CPR2 bacterium GWD2_39_7]HBG81960.1 hypothetical protein [candidate division CPR2 bacterium]
MLKKFLNQAKWLLTKKKIAVPRMGTLYWLLYPLSKRLKFELQEQPKITQKTVKKGSLHAEEGMCLPFKYVLGNFMDALEKGANIVLFAGGIGPCRFGYYSPLFEATLKDLGYLFRLISIEPWFTGRGFIDKYRFWRSFAKLGRVKNPIRIAWAIWESFYIAQCIDEITSMLNYTRAIEVKKGSTNRAYRKALDLLANSKHYWQAKRNFETAKEMMAAIKTDASKLKGVVGIVGEFYVVLEPSANMRIIEWLNDHGIAVICSIFVTDWVGPDTSPKVAHINKIKAHELAKKEDTFHRWCGGDCTANVGHAVYLMDHLNVDAIIQLLPFTCMPDTMATVGLMAVTEKRDIPFARYIYDEHSALAGLETRWEGLIDTIEMKRLDKELHEIAQREAVRSKV